MFGLSGHSMLWTRYLKNALREILHISTTCPLQLKVELIRFERSKVNFKATSYYLTINVLAIIQHHSSGTASEPVHRAIQPRFLFLLKTAGCWSGTVCL